MEEKAEYSRLLVSGALERGQQSPLTLNLRSRKKAIAKRVVNIMDKKEKNKKRTFVCLGMMALCLLGSSFTVLAYDHVYITENSSPKNVGIVTGAGCFQGESEENV